MMNFQHFNVMNIGSKVVLLTAFLSVPALTFAAQPEHQHTDSQHDQHMMHGASRPQPQASESANAVPVPQAPDPVVMSHDEHLAHSEPVNPQSENPESKIGSVKPDSTKPVPVRTVHGTHVSTAPQGGKLRSPDYSDGYQNTVSHHMMSSPNLWSVDAEKLELTHDDHAQQNTGQYELKFWYGNDYNRLYLNTSGEFAQNDLEQASTSLMWWRPFSTYWNTTFGLKQDYDADSTDQTWLGFGISGLAPYWFDVEGSIYGTTTGHSQLELKASYDLNMSQKWVLQPEIELRAYGKTSEEHRYGAGLAKVNTGMRLRYEVAPQFAPYVGFERERFLGKTARLYKASEGRSSSSKVLLGIRFWY